MMVDDAKNYWGSRRCPLLGILNNKNTTFRKLDLFPSSDIGRDIPTLSDQWLSLDLSKGPNNVGVALCSREDEKDAISEVLCFLIFRIPDDGQSPVIQ
jgi:hypothetical protein